MKRSLHALKGFISILREGFAVKFYTNRGIVQIIVLSNGFSREKTLSFNFIQTSNPKFRRRKSRLKPVTLNRSSNLPARHLSKLPKLLKINPKRRLRKIFSLK